MVVCVRIVCRNSGGSVRDERAAASRVWIYARLDSAAISRDLASVFLARQHPGDDWVSGEWTLGAGGDALFPVLPAACDSCGVSWSSDQPSTGRRAILEIRIRWSRRYWSSAIDAGHWEARLTLIPSATSSLADSVPSS